MLSPDVELVHFDAASLDRWSRLLLPPRVLDEPRWALLVIEGDRLIHAIIAPEGAVPTARVPFTGTDPDALDALAEALEVDAVIVVESDAIARLQAEIDSELTLDQDFAAQGLVMLRAAKRLSGAGIWSRPSLLDIVPAPRYEALQRTFDLLIPDRTAMLAYVIADDRRSIHTSIIAVKARGDIELVTTHAGIAGAIAPADFARSWRSQYKRVLGAVEDRYARPSVAIFLEQATVARIMSGPPDQLGREINRKNVIIDPAPAWLLGLLGGATVAAVATRGARALGRYVPEQARRMARDLASSAGTALRDSGADPFAFLGFDPIELWREVRHFYRR